MKYDIIKGKKICFWCDREIKPKEALLHEQCSLRFKKRIPKPVDIFSRMNKRRARAIDQLQKEMQKLHEYPEEYTEAYLKGRLKVLQRYL